MEEYTNEATNVRDDYRILKEIGFTDETVCYIINHSIRDTHQPIEYWVSVYIESFFRQKREKELRDYICKSSTEREDVTA